MMIEATLLGSRIGLVAGHYRRVDTVLTRVVDGSEAFPRIPQETAIRALSVTFARNTAHLVREATLMKREQPDIESAQAIGIGATNRRR